MKDLNDGDSSTVKSLVALPVVSDETPKNIISKRPLVELPVPLMTSNDTHNCKKNTSSNDNDNGNNNDNDNSKKKKTKRFPLHVEAIVNPCCPISFHLLQSEIELFVRNEGQNTFMVCFFLFCLI